MITWLLARLAGLANHASALAPPGAFTELTFSVLDGVLKLAKTQPGQWPRLPQDTLGRIHADAVDG